MQSQSSLQEDWRFIYSLTGQQKHVGLLKKAPQLERKKRKVNVWGGVRKMPFS